VDAGMRGLFLGLRDRSGRGMVVAFGFETAVLGPRSSGILLGGG